MYSFFDFDLSQMSFEWDEQKDQKNFAKHGIHFRTAAKVFLDPNKLIREDEEHPEELRYDILVEGDKRALPTLEPRLVVVISATFHNQSWLGSGKRPFDIRIILGKVGKVLFVVCAFKEENVIRLISARIATPIEKERYEHDEDDFE